MQREISACLGVVNNKSNSAPADLVRACRNLADAVVLCIQLSRLSHAAICERLGVDRGHWSRILQARAHFPLRALPALMELAGNLAPLQWLAARMGFRLVPIADDERVAMLERELAELRGAA